MYLIKLDRLMMMKDDDLDHYQLDEASHKDQYTVLFGFVEL